MWSHILLTAGIIGNGWHSKRVQKILKKKKINCLIYKPNNKNYFDKLKFDKLKKLKIIFIISPNKSHLDYIKKLSKGRYIFCEKPPVTTLSEINYLKKINSTRIYFNFNYRFSKISEILNDRKKLKLGKLIYANLISGQAFAKKNNYILNWRSNKKKCPTGVFEMKSIHLIDLINFHFDVKNFKGPILKNYSKKGTSSDTSYFRIELKNNSYVDIFTSYFVPLVKKQTFIFDNGLIEQTDKKIILKTPALNLNKKGIIINPKIKLLYKTDERRDYLNSLDKSVTYFLKIFKEGKTFPKKFFKTSLKSNLSIV